jgi:hypothetical protein
MVELNEKEFNPMETKGVGKNIVSPKMYMEEKLLEIDGYTLRR